MADRPGALTEVAPGVLVARAGLWSTATTVVVGDDGCLLVDPGVTPTELAGLAGQLAGLGLRVVAGFATHAHWDHVLWARGLGDAPRWATGRTADDAARDHAALAAEADASAPGHDHALTGSLRALPDGAARVPWDGPPAVVLPYAAHCAGSAALWLPEARVLVAGDVLSDVEVPLLDPTDPRGPVGHAAALSALVAAADGAAVLVPGHGTTTGAVGLRDRLAADLAYLDAVVRGAEPDESRLADPEQRAAHEAQVRAWRDLQA